MSDNQVARYDFIDDEGDMSDFLDDADGEYYGIDEGPDTGLDDYDIVSFVSLLCWFFYNYAKFHDEKTV